ncbi:heavy metal response regulator transcription factor [Pigmentibacter ruber]|uniref:heavy metal response regulator transcription factor n=1 Tax=Pigmentibacter ruber TaxID=2683196 RepID=UPI00131B23F1|nr:heavy metal response regulator transcription factor [Pigmentibacter ruber]BFD32607.1 heavy metal response regulator transcription factor [Pigmentibacter ruber]
MKILIIEDAEKTASFLKKGLTEKGYVVDVESNGQEGLILAQVNNYDLIILDVMLPQLDGWSILKELRASDNKTHIIMLTARDDIEDKVKGLNLGADDYLVKPFAFSELVARIQTVLRRKPTIQKDILSFADLEIDFNKKKVSREGKKIELTPKEFMLLSLLIRNHNVALSRSEISEKIWNINFDTDTNVVDVHIRRLRAKIDDGFNKKFIKTVRGIGYMFDES